MDGQGYPDIFDPGRSHSTYGLDRIELIIEVIRMEKEEIRKAVRKEYGNVATQGSSCGCGCGCGPEQDQDAQISALVTSRNIGYSDEQLDSVPGESVQGLGCGNPVALASLKEGETFLDLGSGPGLDCFLAAERVGRTGKVIGVDMTPEMIDKARENITMGDFENVEFRLGEIEHLPVADNSVDVITSNCVINLSVDKKAVFQEAYRVLKPGGRLMISDIVLVKELPESILNSIQSYVGCVSGAILKDKYLKLVKDVGFSEVEVVSEVKVGSLGYSDQIADFNDALVSLTYTATKSKEADYGKEA
jgi:SAM-dependent methyltransferase